MSTASRRARPAGSRDSPIRRCRRRCRSSIRATPRSWMSRGWRAKRESRARCLASDSSNCSASRQCAIARGGACASPRTCSARASRIRRTSATPSASTARQRSIARSNGSSASLRLNGGAGSRLKRSTRALLSVAPSVIQRVLRMRSLIAPRPMAPRSLMPSPAKASRCLRRRTG